ncbi:MAG: ABC transporter permease subunit, partial [Acetobacteraceae bacterium]|nr:ABC transporter permease subunit [Acetobacteraceae bacterium]
RGGVGAARAPGDGAATLRLLALLWLLAVGAAPVLRLLAEVGNGAALAGLWGDAPVWRAAGRSLFVALGGAAVAAAIGAALSAVLLLREVPLRRTLIFLVILPLLVPAQVLALAFIFVGGPSSPLLLALGLAPPLGTTNPIYSPGGIILLLGVQGAPLVFLSVAAAVRRLPGDAVAAARGLGASPGRALREVAWPILLPAVAAGTGLAYVAALGNFGIAALIGIPARYPLLTVLIWERLSGIGPSALTQVAALSILLAAMALPGLLLQAYAARAASLASSVPFRPLPMRGGWAASGAVLLYVVLVLVVPMIALLSAALVPAMGMEIGPGTATARNFAAIFAPGAHTLRALTNSLLLAAGAAAVLALAVVPVALALRSRLVRSVSAVADLPYALPGACTGVAAILLAFLIPGAAALYGTLWLIGLAYLTRYQALALRPVAAAAARLDRRIEEAAQGLGAGPWRRLAEIQAPLLAPAVAAGAILVMLLSVNEVTVSSLLYGPGSQTLGVLVFTLQDSGQSPMAAAVSTVSLVLVGALMAVATLAGRGLPPGTLPWRP